MACEVQFTSLNGTAQPGESSDIWRKPSTIARRSVSIFSRRGTTTPEPKPAFIAQAVMRAPKHPSERQKSWVRRKSVPADSLPKSPKGTILNAVPPARVIEMSPLEEEMATSPNEEILSAISGTPTTPVMFTWPAPTKEQIDSLWKQTHVPLAQRAQSVRRKDRNSRIGVWRNGVAHWDDEARRDGVWWTDSNLQASTGFAPLQRVPTEKLNAKPTQKPTLSVIVPVDEPLGKDAAISTFLHSTPKASVVPVAPANILPTFTVASPTSPIRESHNPKSPSMSTPTAYRAALSGSSASSPVETRAKITDIRRTRQLSCSSSGSSFEQDADSDDSRESSATSIDTLTANSTPRKPDENPLDFLAADQSSRPITPMNYSATISNIDKPLPLCPIPPKPIRAAPPPPPSPSPSQTSPFPSGYSERVRRPSVKSMPDASMLKKPRPSGRKPSSGSLPQLDLIDQEFLRNAPDLLYGSMPNTPTPSQSESYYGTQLSNSSSLSLHQYADSTVETALECVGDPQKDQDGGELSLTKSCSLHRRGSVHSVMHPPERVPTIPKRSRKRDWRVARHGNRAVQLSVRAARRRKSESNLKPMTVNTDSVPSLRKSPSAAELSFTSDVARLRMTPLEAFLPPAPRIVVDDGLVVLTGPVRVLNATYTEAPVSSSAAEDVLLHILASLENTADLFNSARINRGMYRVFKENEMDLIQRVMHNQSPPAWEFREWRIPTEPLQRQSRDSTLQIQHTPQSYMHAYHQDLAVISALKSLILERCQTVIRRETAIALSSPHHPNAQRFTDAFWRIWCFCTIFGSGKGRENDVTGQLDWLRGGLLATNSDLTATMNMNLDYDVSSVLINPPDHFATGNEGGLSAQQLYDMIEIFACMKTLLEGYHYRTEQAWACGIFGQCGIGIGDDETEAELLEEWTAHLLTLGPNVVLQMAEFANEPSSAGFVLAKVMGWGTWSPPEHNGTRQDFLKEPVSRLYEERVAAAASKLENSQEKEKKESSRRRVATLAAEIKLARQASSFRRRPFIDMSLERSMSASSRCSDGNASASSPASGRSAVPLKSPARSANPARGAAPPPLPKRQTNLSVPMSSSSPPPSTLWSPRKISPIIEDRVETFNRMSLQHFGTGVAEDTAERALKRIVDMGFSASQARQALMMTDMGDGLRVDRAVDLLLKQGS